MAEVTKINFKGTVLDIRDANAARASDLAAKQDVISDLSAIRSGASKGATSVQSISVNGGEPSTPDTNGNVDLQVSGGQGSNGFTINETATALVLTVWDGAELVETATSITIQQS